MECGMCGKQRKNLVKVTKQNKNKNSYFESYRIINLFDRYTISIFSFGSKPIFKQYKKKH